MKRLSILPTESNFAVDLNPEDGIFIFKGESRPENAPHFFEPILEWLEQYRVLVAKEELKTEIDVQFHLDYFNSTSSKYIVDIAKKLKEIDNLENVNIQALWYYKSIDEDILESGEEIKDWTGLNLKLAPVD